VYFALAPDKMAATNITGPKLSQHLSGNTVRPYEHHLYPVIASA
jgi:hypothetical protein